MLGAIRRVPGKKIIPDFFCGSAWDCRVCMCSSGHITGLFLPAVLSRVVFVDAPTMGGI